MRIFVLGSGATGSLLAQLLARQGHQVTCGDRNPERARRFLGKKSRVPIRAMNARSLWSIVKAARGRKGERHAMVRFDAVFPSLHQIRRREVYTSPIAWATAHMAALFVKHFPRGLPGVHPPEALPAKTRQAILSGARACGIHISRRLALLKPVDDEE